MARDAQLGPQIQQREDTETRTMRPMQRVALLVVLHVIIACGGTSPPAAPVTPPSTKPADEFAPMLFTLEQLRDGIPQGRVIEIRMEIEGNPTTIEHWEFTKVDATSATIHSITTDEAGKSLADETGTSTWEELHSHGKFPAAATTFEDNVSITVPAGTFTTRLYTVKTDDGRRQFWFAADLPGPPVQFTTEKDGKVVMRAVMQRAR